MKLSLRLTVAALASVLALPMLGMAVADAAPAAPKKGACYAYSIKGLDAAYGPTKTVPCSTKHTAVTYYVGTVTGTAASSASPLDPAVVLATASGCRAAIVRKVGVKAASLTRLTFGYFVPTPAQWAAGARWYRCDAVLAKSSGTLASIPKNFLRVVATAKGISTYRRCLTKGGKVVACTSGKAYFVARKFVTLGTASAAYPGDAEVASSSFARCNRALAKPVRYATWPLAEGWSIGQRTSTCYLRA
jgi:hypothetical protein